MAGILSVLAGNIVFPTLSRLRDDPDQLQAKLVTGLQQVSIVMAPAGVLLACVAPVLIVPVLGHRFAPYRASFAVLSILAVYAALRTMLAVFFEGYKAVGKPWLVPVYNGCKLLVLVPSMIVGAHYGVVGLALGYLPVTLLEIPSAMGLVFVVLGVTPRQAWTSIRAPVLATGCMAGVAVAIESSVVAATHGSDPAALALAMLGGAATYVAALYLLDRRLLGEARTVLFAGL
jgi:hypothetical protein